MTPAEAAREILRRDAARDSLAVYAMERGFWPARHHLHLIDRLEAVARGDIKRLMVFMPPGSAKSTYTSQLFPAWLAAQPFLSGRTGWDILATSNTSTLAEEFSLKVRRHARESEKLLGYELSGESQAVGRWEIKGRAVYRCAGAGAAIAGQRADVALIDDPIRGSEEADSETQRAKIWRWYTDDLRQRVKPEGAVIVVQCMTGDTPVMLADGTERALSNIAPGDLVATYDDGSLCASRVIAWRSQGHDDIHEITTRSGVRLKANERHPFLTVREGVTEWKRLRDLRPGDCLVRMRSGANGRGPLVLPMAAPCQQNVEGSAHPTTTRLGGLLASGPHRAIPSASGQPTSSTDTALPVPSTTNFSPNRAVGARFADASRTSPSRHIGAGGSASTTATTQGPSGGCSATTATCGSDAGQPSRSLKPAWNTCDFTEDDIVDIRPAGRSEVFDLQVEGTENFLASGVVSHNTRWHEDDLSGRILPADWDGESGRIRGRDGEWWEVVCLPQLAARDDDPLGRTHGEPLWPEWMPLEACETLRGGMTPRSWSALHQQRPSPDTGGFFDRKWFGRFTAIPPGRSFLASDWATPEGTDWTVHVVVSVDASNRLYVADVWRGRGTTAESIDAALDLCARYSCSAWLNEKGVLWRTISGQAQARMRERNVFVPNEEYARTSDKPTMARAIQGRWSQGMVMLPEQAPWLADLEAELLRFPAGRHDDQVDALALIGLHLDKVVAPPKQAFGMVRAPEDRMWS